VEWTDTGIILSATPHGERAAVVSVLSANHGRWQGRVNAAQSGAKKAWLCAGTVVQASWHARLEEQLGSFALEPTHHTTAFIFDEPAALLAMEYVARLTADIMPERLPLPVMFEILHHYIHQPYALAHVINYERALLDTMGYGLDVSSCAVTGTTQGLTHISPNTGRAVCAAEAEPYKDRLLPLPSYWLGDHAPSVAELAYAARVTGHFLAQHFYQPPRNLPAQRTQLLMMEKAVSALK